MSNKIFLTIVVFLLVSLFGVLANFANAAPARNPCYITGSAIPSQFNNCVDVGISSPLPVVISSPPVSTTAVVNCGGSITTGGTAQPLFTAAQFKQGFFIQIGANDSNTDSLYFSDGTTTVTPGAGVAGSMSIGPSTATAPGGSFTSPLNFPVGVAYFINGATTGDKYKCRVW